MYSILDDRSIISIDGEDRFKFLQGLITNDIYKLNNSPSIYACMLTAQGKYFADMFLVSHQNSILLDVPRARKDDLLQKFNMYKLRSQIKVNDLPEYSILSQVNSGIVFSDPRNSELGMRAFIHQDELAIAINGLEEDKNTYDKMRIRHFIAEGEKDLVSGKSFLLEYGLEHLNAIDYQKGCYIGQELVARSHYTGVIRKQIVQVIGNLAEAQTEIYAGEQKLGKLCSHVGSVGLALIRTEDVLSLSKDTKITAASEEIKIIFKEI